MEISMQSSVVSVFCTLLAVCCGKPTVTTEENGSVRCARGVSDNIASFIDYNKKGCDYSSIAVASQICETLFFNELKADKNALCSKVYNKLTECISSKHEECKTDGTSSRAMKRSVRKSMGNYALETRYCNDGSLSVAKGRPINYCAADYNKQVAKCYSNYHRIFRRNPGNQSLCVEYAMAKSCAAKVGTDLCLYIQELNQVRQLSENTTRCWNPFCSESLHYNISVTSSVLTFSELRKTIENKLNLLEISQKDESKISQKHKGNKNGVPSDCKNNLGVVFLELLGEIDNAFNTFESVGDDPGIVICNSEDPTSLAATSNIDTPNQSDSGNGCNEKYKSLYSLLYIMHLIVWFYF